MQRRSDRPTCWKWQGKGGKKERKKEGEQESKKEIKVERERKDKETRGLDKCTQRLQPAVSDCLASSDD